MFSRDGCFSRSLSCLFLLLVCLLLSPTAFGQFQEPTKEELTMTSDPKAPGAAAVYLFFEEKTDDPLHYHSVRARIKVLTEKGKDLATVTVPYLHGETKVTDIQARTIHSDGTVIPLQGKPEDLLQVKTGDRQINKRVFTLPSVEVGSILEYEYQIRYDDSIFSSPEWEIQKPYFVHKAHYMFMPFKAFQKGANAQTSQYLTDSHGNTVHTLMWWKQLPQGKDLVNDPTGRFSLDLEDIPAIPDEDYMPPMDAFLYQLEFFYTSAHDGAEYWREEGKRWSKDTDHFAETSGKIKDAVARIVTPGDTALVKAQKLYKAVQALDNTDYTRAKSKAELKVMGLKPAKRAEDTWAQKSGDSRDITLLYLAMLRAAGLTAYDIKVVNRARSLFQPGYMYFGQLDDDLVILSVDGKDIYLDPGEKMCPFQLVSWTHQGASGVRQDEKGPDIAVIPSQPYTLNTTTRMGDVTLDASGGVAGNLRIIMDGQEALRWRQIALENDADEVKKRFDNMLQNEMPDGVEAHVDHFLALDNEDVNLMAMIKVSGALGAHTGKRMLLPGFFYESRSRQPFVAQAERWAPVDMHYAGRTLDQVTYHLPDGMTVEGAPKGDHIVWPQNAELIIKTEQRPGEITVGRLFARGFTALRPKEYQDLRGFYQKVATSDQQQVVLTGATKGN